MALIKVLVSVFRRLAKAEHGCHEAVRRAVKRGGSWETESREQGLCDQAKGHTPLLGLGPCVSLGPGSGNLGEETSTYFTAFPLATSVYSLPG